MDNKVHVTIFIDRVIFSRFNSRHVYLWRKKKLIHDVANWLHNIFESFQPPLVLDVQGKLSKGFER